jgi:hypothetical protein
MSPNRTTDDEVVRALQKRVTDLVDADDPTHAPYPFALPDEIVDVEARLGFHLPPCLRRVYEIANGGVGPGIHGLLPIGEGKDTLATVCGFRPIVNAKIGAS